MKFNKNTTYNALATNDFSNLVQFHITCQNLFLFWPPTELTKL